MLSRFAPEVVANEAAMIDKFVNSLRLDLQGFNRAFRPTTNVDALRPTVDMSTHEKADPSKTTEKWSTIMASSGDCYSRKDLERTTCLS
ncbi:gag-protease polyprotein [Cucumis melo var. makuwa]|uniref:Gag-protease polyprotein n=1 Tax=Cucumis melo var. makuwa TaxID=1194695 RepID=A0A5A7UBC5_CUCMM|nr:gag-protease polyprotein [Cucumis melo var. makuwa]